MPVSRSLLIRSLALFALAFFASAALWVGLVSMCRGVPLLEYAWTRQILDKKAAARASMPGPAFVFIGGSATHFGVNAEEVSKQLHASAVNNGAHAGTQVAYILWEARRALRPGDVAVLGLETNLLLDEDTSDYAIGYANTMGTDFLDSRPVTEQLSKKFAAPPILIVRSLLARRKPPGKVPGEYDSATVTTFGDESANLRSRQTRGPLLDRPSGIVAAKLRAGKGLASPARRALDTFVQWCQARRIRVVYIHPPVMDQPMLHDPLVVSGMARIDRQLEQRGVSVLDRAEDELYPKSELFDAAHHLVHDAAITRSQRIAKLLAKL